MKKYLILFLLLSFSCQKDETILQPTVSIEFIFDNTTNIVHDNQVINFQWLYKDLLTLSISNGIDVISKENFNSTVGLNTKKLYTKSLPKGQYVLSLLKGSEKLFETIIIVE